MTEKRGYPNPNYSDRDVDTFEPLEVNAQIMIDDKDYRELVVKAALFDLISATIKGRIDRNYHYAVVDSDFIMAITGMDAYLAQKKAEAHAEEVEDE